MQVKDNQFLGVTPVLPVNNVKETAKFYEEMLGFTIEVICENPNYACVSRGEVSIDFGEGRPEHVGSGISFIHMKEVEAFFKECKSLGLNLVGDCAERDYGSKDFRVRDNNGNLLIFGTPMDNQKELLAKINLVD
jgi:uncharacterized glyoxalase superfamily protein PhnB